MATDDRSPGRSLEELDTLEGLRRRERELADFIENASVGLHLDVGQVVPASFIEPAVEALRPAAEAKDVRIQKVMDAGVASVEAHGGRVSVESEPGRGSTSRFTIP